MANSESIANGLAIPFAIRYSLLAAPHSPLAMKQSTYIGKPIGRIEDRPLLTGGGRFVGDLRLPRMLDAAFVRSPHAHARIRRVDVRAARAHPPVHAVLAFGDLIPLLSQERLPLGYRTDELPPDITPFALARDVVAFVGE